MFNNMSCCHPHWYADDGFPCWADLSEVTPVLILAWSLRAFCGHIVPRETAGRAVRFWRFVASQQQVVVIIHVAMLRRLRHPCSGASESIRTRTIPFCLWNISKDEKFAVAHWCFLRFYRPVRLHIFTQSRPGFARELDRVSSHPSSLPCKSLSAQAQVWLC